MDIRPKQILRDIGRQYPNAWTQIKEMRAIKGTQLPSWPDWCYIPIAAGVAIATQGINSNIIPATFAPINPAIIAAAAAWRVSQGVYRYDADLYNTLTKQTLDGEIPCEILKRLPEYCVYIETLGATIGDSTIVGFWAHLESDINTGGMELRLVLMGKDGLNIPLPIHLGDWTIKEGLKRTFAQASTNLGFKFPHIDLSSDVTPLVQLILYLCADNVDIPARPQHPATRATTSGRIDAPKEPRVWDVGERIGASIRKYRNEKNVQTEKNLNSGERTHASPRPHVRKAHWHHFRTGIGRSGLILKWIPPTAVGIDDDNNPVTIHKVD